MTQHNFVAIYLLKEIEIIKDPEVAKLFADETRRQILHILRRHEKSATDLAKSLGKSHSSIFHHLKLDYQMIALAIRSDSDVISSPSL